MEQKGKYLIFSKQVHSAILFYLNNNYVQFKP